MNARSAGHETEPRGVALLESPTLGSTADGPRAGPTPRTEPAPQRKSRPGRVVFVALFLALAASGGYAWYAGLVNPRKLAELLPWQMEPRPVALMLHGNVDVRQVNLAFKVEGRIASLNVDEGDPVAVGAVVATLDRRYFEDELRLARAQRDAQAATLARLEHGSRPEEIAEARALVAEREATVARTDLYVKRVEKLVASNSVTRRNATTPRPRRASLGPSSSRPAMRSGSPRSAPASKTLPRPAQLAAQEAEVTRSERRYQDAQLIAPGRGIILTRAREVGAIVQPGEIVFTLTLSNPVWVRTYVSEPNLGRVHPGSEVEVLTDTDPSRPYRGSVGFISSTAEFTPKPVESDQLRTALVYRVRIVVDDPNNDLRQGMPVTVRLPLTAGGSSP